MYECLAHEKPEMLMTYLAMHHTIEHIPSASNSFEVSNIQLIMRFYKAYTSPQNFLVQSEFIESYADRLHQYFFQNYDAELTEYFKSGKWSNDTVFACFLTYLDAPYPHQSFTLADVLQLSKQSTFTPPSTWIQIALSMEKGEYY